MNLLVQAREQFTRLQPHLSSDIAQRIAQRLQIFEQHDKPILRPTAGAAASTQTEILLLTRPGAPPRPISSTLFVIKNDAPHD